MNPGAVFRVCVGGGRDGLVGIISQAGGTEALQAEDGRLRMGGVWPVRLVGELAGWGPSLPAGGPSDRNRGSQGSL